MMGSPPRRGQKRPMFGVFWVFWDLEVGFVGLGVGSYSLGVCGNVLTHFETWPR